MLLTRTFKTYFGSIILISLLFHFTSCETNIYLDVNNSPNLPTVNCILTKNERISLQLTKSIPIKSNTDSSALIKNASVKIFRNGLLMDSLVYNEVKYDNKILGGYLSLKRIQSDINDRYDIKVSIPGNKDLYSSTIIPQPISILSVDTNTVYLKNGRNTYKVIEFSIKFNDPSQYKNYYKISIERLGLIMVCLSGGYDCNNKIGIYNAPMYCLDENAVYLKLDNQPPQFLSFENEINENWFKEVFISDNSFNGITKEIKVLVPLWWLVDVAYPPGNESMTKRKVNIKLYSINEDYYKYSSSCFSQIEKKNDLFSEPVQVFSNISNGIGIFSGESVSVDSSIIMSISYNPVTFK